MLGIAMSLFSCNVLSRKPLKCVSMNNQECKVRHKIVDFNSDEPAFLSYGIKTSKCSVVKS